MKAISAVRIVTLVLLFASLAIINLSCDTAGCADVYLEGVTIGSVTVEGKPVTGLPTQKVDILLNINAGKINISTSGPETIIKLSPSGTTIVSGPNGISFTGVKPEQVEFKWQSTSTK